MAQLCQEFLRFDLLILGISETRWPDSGETTVANGLRFLFSGKPAGQRREGGVGFLLSKSAQNALLEWKAHTERIISIRLRTRARNVTIFQCYAPTDMAETETKEEFYSSLSRAVSTARKGDILMVMGDFNAQVGNVNTGMEHTMGRHGIGHMSENGELFTEWCSNNNLVIGGTLFPHKDVHKVTWVSPDQHTQNQIDHFSISRKWRGSLLDVRNRRGADVATDHHLIIARIKLKVAAIKSDRINSRRLDVRKLLIPTTANMYTERLRAAVSRLENEPSWDECNHIFLKVAEDTLGYRRIERKEWISDRTWELICNRMNIKAAINNAKTRASKTALQSNYNDADRAVKKSARRDKRLWAENIATEAQAASDTNRSRDLYNTVKRLTKKFSVSSKPIKKPDGSLTSSQQEQISVWTEFYRDMLSNPDATASNVCDCAQHTERQDIDTTCPDLAEIIGAIKDLKVNKASGPDNILPELLKTDPITSAMILLPLISRYWETEQLVQQVKQGTIIKIPKKGDLSECKNWRGITLLNTSNKVIARILHKRLEKALSSDLRTEQAGFRPQRSCIDHVNTLRIIVEQSVEWRSPLYLAFIDFEKAFDTIQYEAIWTALMCKGIPRKLIALIKELYTEATCQVSHENHLGEPIPINAGVRQGCVLSPMLFNIALDEVMKKVTKEKRGISWGLQGNLEDLEYADDICLLAHKKTHMKDKLDDVHKQAAKFGLKINIAKTKIMCINVQSQQQFEINGQAIENVQQFCYLGSIISVTGGSSEDIQSRVRKGRAAFGSLDKVWRSSHISRNTKIRLFNSNVKSVLLYGCESWNAATREIQTMQAFINRCLRKILRIFWPATISNSSLWLITQQQPIQSEIKRRKWKWIGHTLRKPANDIAKAAIDWNPQGSRRRGRPANTWRRFVESEALEAGHSWREIRTIALNRVVFNNFVKALCST